MGHGFTVGRLGVEAQGKKAVWVALDAVRPDVIASQVDVVPAERGAAGAGFRSLTEAIDTTTPADRMMMQMVGAFAEFERAMIRERTSAGLAQARAEGRIGGRRRKLGDKQRAEIAESVLSGRKTAAEMARNLSCQPADGLPHRQRATNSRDLGQLVMCSHAPPTLP